MGHLERERQKKEEEETDRKEEKKGKKKANALPGTCYLLFFVFPSGLAWGFLNVFLAMLCRLYIF